MVMSYFYALFLGISLFGAFLTGNGSALATATVQGAQTGISLSISLAGPLCLWSGVGMLMERIGMTEKLSVIFRPVLHKIFPSTKQDPKLSASLSANICANLLGLGNAATPMGIQSAKRLCNPHNPTVAGDELCRLVVLNTASIQLIPTNVAAIRSSLGCSSPFDILPAVWLTSLCSAGLGVLASYLLGRIWKHD